MDLYRAIHTLHEERKRLDRLIVSLERLQAQAERSKARGPARKRGRKGMSAEERKKVSERMRKYWAARRAQQAAGGAPPPAAS